MSKAALEDAKRQFIDANRQLDLALHGAQNALGKETTEVKKAFEYFKSAIEYRQNCIKYFQNVVKANSSHELPDATKQFNNAELQVSQSIGGLQSCINGSSTEEFKYLKNALKYQRDATVYILKAEDLYIKTFGSHSIPSSHYSDSDFGFGKTSENKQAVGVSAGEVLDHWVHANELTASSDRIAKELGKACVDNVYNIQGVSAVTFEGLGPMALDLIKGNPLSVIKSATNILQITVGICAYGMVDKAVRDVRDFISESNSSYQGDGGNQANEVGPMGLDSSGNSSNCYPGGDSGVC